MVTVSSKFRASALEGNLVEDEHGKGEAGKPASDPSVDGVVLDEVVMDSGADSTGDEVIVSLETDVDAKSFEQIVEKLSDLGYVHERTVGTTNMLFGTKAGDIEALLEVKGVERVSRGEGRKYTTGP